ncbi:MAG: MmgE/PrpD family protein [Pseudomonadota bacterium]
MPGHPPAGAAGNETARLAAFAAGLRAGDIPTEVMERAVDLYVDWAGSTLSGKGHHAVEAISAYARAMGPHDGPAEILIDGTQTSPHFAAMVNGAAGHVSEQDDVHNGSVFHPGAVVFPAALAAAQANGATGRAMLVAAVAGYEVGIRVGEFLGRSHYKVHHTTGTAGTFAAAAATGHVLGLNAVEMGHALGSAGTRSAGLWEFLRDAADSKQLHTAAAASDGLMAAVLAQNGFRGASRILEGAQGLAAGTSTDADPQKLVDRLGERWALSETSFKYHASCRHTHPAADALLAVMERERLTANDLKSVVARVHQGAIDVLGAVTSPQTVHQAKFSMPATLGLIAVHGRAGLKEYDGVLEDEPVAQIMPRISMALDEEVDAAYPARWLGRVTVTTTDGRTLNGAVDEPKGDPANTLSRSEIDRKARALALSGGAVAAAQLDRLMADLWSIETQPSPRVLPLRKERAA